MGFISEVIGRALFGLCYSIWSASTGTEAEKASRADAVEWLSGNGLTTSNELPEYWSKVRLIHVEELRTWDSFRIYHPEQGISYKEYLIKFRGIKRLKSELSELIETKKKASELDSDNYVVYEIRKEVIPRSFLFRTKRIFLFRKNHRRILQGTVIRSDIGLIRRGELRARGGWRRKEATITYSCPSKIKHQSQIDLLNDKLAVAPLDKKRNLLYLEENLAFTHPVLFISHRWKTPNNPDPNQENFRKLCRLKDCFIIYDYSSFPQKGISPQEDINQVLLNMNKFVDNVVVLKSDDYLTRGWCVYEYFLASLKCSIVCDEIQNPNFVNLRDVISTQSSLTAPFIGTESTSARQENFISQNIIDNCRKVLNLYYKEAVFGGATQYVTDDTRSDKEYVDKILKDFVLSVLPRKREYMIYGGDWEYISWTKEDIEKLFSSELSVSYYQRIMAPINLNSTNVPSTIEEAVRENYTIKKQSLWYALIPGEFKMPRFFTDPTLWEDDETNLI